MLLSLIKKCEAVDGSQTQYVPWISPSPPALVPSTSASLPTDTEPKYRFEMQLCILRILWGMQSGSPIVIAPSRRPWGKRREESGTPPATLPYHIIVLRVTTMSNAIQS
jgi:hypothetical protein